MQTSDDVPKQTVSDKPAWLLEYAEDVFSQGGEDGVMRKILSMLPERDRWCVEFGAWDGVYLSNARNLIVNEDYSAVLIEGSAQKYAELCQNYLDNNNIYPVNAMVGFEGGDNLDSLLSDTPIPKEFDLLSIDIDGNDYHVWKAVDSYRPKVVVIEYNQTMPNEVEFVQAANPNISQGASLLSMTKLGLEKGYELVSVTKCNAFFVRSEYFPLFHVKDNSPQSLRCNLEDITYLFSGYDGQVFIHGSKKIPWHGISYSQRKMQVLPAFLRKFPEHYSKLESWGLFAFYIYKELVANPISTIKRAWKRLFGNGQ